MMRCAAPLALLLLVAANASAAALEATDAEPLVDLAGTTQTVTPGTVRLELDLEGFPGAGADRGKAEGSGRGKKTSLRVARVEGTWKTGEADVFRTSPDAEFEVDASGLEVGPDRLGGTLVLARPGKGERGRTAFTIDARVRPAPADAFWPKNDIDIRTWPYYFMYPRSQGAAWEVAGAWTAGEAKGRVTGFAAPPMRPGFWNMGSEAEGGGVRFTFRLGAERQNWNYGRLARYVFAEPRDLSAFQGVRLSVAPEKTRRDVEVGFWLREADGSWWRAKSAVALVDNACSSVVLFDDLSDGGVASPTWSFDENHRFDPEAVTEMAVGIIDAFGPGEVAFTLRGIELVKVPRPEPGPARVAVTGETRAVNGHRMVPVGLFGGFSDDLPQSVRPGCQRAFGGGPSIPPPGATEKFRIDVWADRYASARSLTDPAYRDHMAARAREYAARAREAGYAAHLEFWNEPYLNWARTRKNFDARFYEKRGEAAIVKATGFKVPHFTWEGGEVVDASQHSYYSARGNSALYDLMLLTVARAVKETYPDVRVIVSWGFRWKADHWTGWEYLYKPSIDRAAAWIDGASEHHYGGDPRSMIGMYEVLAAYGQTRYSKWLYSWNTETGDLSRVPVGGAADTPEKAAHLTQYRKAMYNVRDIVLCAREAPDKIRSRTLLTWRSQDPRAMPVAYGLLKDLRGRLLRTTSDDAKVWCVASVDGADPDAPRPEPGQALVVCVFNDHAEPRDVALQVAAPKGTRFAGGGTVQTIPLDPETFEFRLASEPVEAEGASRAFPMRLGGRSVWKVALPLEGELGRAVDVHRRQFFAPRILREVVPGETYTATVEVDAAALATAERAYLRLVLEDVAHGEGVVRVGGTELPLPAAYTSENQNRTVDLPVDPKVLAERTRLEFIVRGGDFAGYRVDMASVVVEGS